MTRLSELAVLARRREILVKRLDTQRGQIVGLIQELGGPVRTVDRWWHLALNLGSVLPTVLLGGSLMATLWAVLGRRRRGGVPARPRSWLATAFTVWRLWRAAQAWLPVLQTIAGRRNEPPRRSVQRYGAVEV